MSRKYEEASYKEKKDEGLAESTQANEKEKKSLISASEAFQEG